MIRHTAVIPARMGSVGLPFKNRTFFDNTADFLAELPWITRVIVSTDDPVIKDMAQARGYEVHHRPDVLAGPAVSIHAVFDRLVADLAVPADEVLWLFYLPVLYKHAADFEQARAMFEAADAPGLMSFVPAQTHPYTCWAWDEAGQRLSQYIANNTFRRQDMPPAWMAYHYTCCLRAGALARLDNELLCPETLPLFLNPTTAANLIEVDTPEDLERWKARQEKASTP